MEALNGHELIDARSDTARINKGKLSFKVHCDKYGMTWIMCHYRPGEPLGCIYCGELVLR